MSTHSLLSRAANQTSCRGYAGLRQRANVASRRAMVSKLPLSTSRKCSQHQISTYAAAKFPVRQKEAPMNSPTPRTNLHSEVERNREQNGLQDSQNNSKSGLTSSTQAAIHEDIYTVPNFLTLTRLVAAPIVGYLVLQDSNAWATGLFAYAGVTDLLDGWIARRWNRKTVVGTVIDPMADKALMTILTVCLAAKGALPMWVAAIILGRDAGLGIAAIYYRWISLPPPKTFARYWDFSLPSAEVHPTTISKYNTFLQLGLVGLTTAAPLFDSDIHTILSILQYTVAATTVWSGASYVFSKDAVKILK